MRLLLALLALLTLSAAPESAAPPPPVHVAAMAALSVPEASVPFGCGLAFPVSQAHDVGSHLQHDTWAWDFRMPEGTPVVAAYEGVVRLARGDSATGGCDPRYAPFANYVVVNHQNGLETQYLHFSKVVVKPGDHVKAGDLLGYSGRTGWACGAHLHFKVARSDGPGWNNPSVHAQIAGYGDPQLDVKIAAPACPQLDVKIASSKEPESQDPAAPAQGASPQSPSPAAVPANAALPAAVTAPAAVGPAKL